MSVKSAASAVWKFVHDAEPVIAAGGAAGAVSAVSAAYVGWQAGHLDLGLVGAAVSAVVSLWAAIAARGQVTPVAKVDAPPAA